MSMSTPTYPKRQQFFALKAVRAMVKTCVANEYGQGVFCLLVTVVHTEDAAHYRRPVTFYEGQLMPLIGVTSRTTFKRVRERAVESGWLVFIPGDRGGPPSYFVQIPDHALGLDDLPTDEGDEWRGELESVSCPKNGHQTDSKRTSNGLQTDSKRATFIPIPNPIPKNPHTPFDEQPARAGVGVLTDVGKKDLAGDDTLEALYRSAVDGGLIQDTEAMRLRFVAEAERVLADKSLRKPGAVFATNVRAGLVTQLSDSDEERGRLRLKRMRASTPVNEAAAALADKLGGPS
jgi:hypothetical protein